MFGSMYKHFGHAVFEDDGIYGESKDIQRIFANHQGNQNHGERYLLKIYGHAKGNDGNHVTESIADAIHKDAVYANVFVNNSDNKQQQLRDNLVAWAIVNENKAVKLYKKHVLHIGNDDDDFPGGDPNNSSDNESDDSQDERDRREMERNRQEQFEHHRDQMKEHLENNTGKAGKEWDVFEFGLLSAALNITIVVVSFDESTIKAEVANTSMYEGHNEEVLICFGHHPKNKILDFTSTKDEYTCLSVVEEPTKAEINKALNYDAYTQSFKFEEAINANKIPPNVGMAALRAFRNNSSDIGKYTNNLLMKEQHEAANLLTVASFIQKTNGNKREYEEASEVHVKQEGQE